MLEQFYDILTLHFEHGGSCLIWSVSPVSINVKAKSVFVIVENEKKGVNWAHGVASVSCLRENSFGPTCSWDLRWCLTEHVDTKFFRAFERAGAFRFARAQNSLHRRQHLMFKVGEHWIRPTKWSGKGEIANFVLVLCIFMPKILQGLKVSHVQTGKFKPAVHTSTSHPNGCRALIY